eukprot:gnl/Dysnectes_brevis/5282_a7528_531.p1 GENE.gnl/Dysnectes_brevis/5282_a7528_531~~gnl/Dysnectes_brevis/5282_a7528_531.p1  ORF type:complete len:259 (+),score=7.18 gnl/Dysnectes_brevis/5282_a7528_531:25-801(+)
MKGTAQIKYPLSPFNLDLCHFCGIAKTKKDNQIFLCDGFCRRAFCQRCLHLRELDTSFLQEEQFICPDCVHSHGQCFICQKSSPIIRPDQRHLLLDLNPHKPSTEDSYVIRCSKNNCPVFFHPSCLFPITPRKGGEHTQTQTTPGSGFKHKVVRGKLNPAVWVVKFTCPCHACCVCVQSPPHLKMRGPLVRCFRCMSAAHTRCAHATGWEQIEGSARCGLCSVCRALTPSGRSGRPSGPSFMLTAKDKDKDTDMDMDS